MYRLCVTIPESHLEQVKEAMFRAGAGSIGHYSHCCWQIKGQGQYMPQAGSQPYQGQINQVEQCPEYKVEMVCDDETLPATIKAMCQAHPYEQVAYAYWAINPPLEGLDDTSISWSAVTE